jgi:FkbM family methyltransferase
VIRKTGVNRLLSTPFWRLVYALKGGTEMHTICGRSVDFSTDSYTEFQRFKNLVGERDVIREVLGSLEPADVFYDVGANVGMYTCFVAAELGADQTVAFEPHEGNADRLLENLQHNGLDAEVIRVALSNSEGKVDLAVAGEQAGEGEHAIATGSAAKAIEIDANRGDALINRRDLPEPTVVKIDVEGAELAALEGLRSSLQESCRLVFCEVHPRKLRNFGSDEEDIHQLLQSHGFKTDIIHRRGDEYFVKAERMDDTATV